MRRVIHIGATSRARVEWSPGLYPSDPATFIALFFDDEMIEGVQRIEFVAEVIRFQVSGRIEMIKSQTIKPDPNAVSYLRANGWSVVVEDIQKFGG